MSRLGKQPLEIPEKTTVIKDGSAIRVKGPLGELSRQFRPEIKIVVEEGKITLTPNNNSKFARSLWGTYSSQLKTMMKGVNELFSKKLIVEGVGFKIEHTGNQLILALGFSHKINVEIPEGITVVVEKNDINISGSDKEAVGSFAAKIKMYKKPEPYKGKGIRYEGEVIRRKQGKKSV